MIHNIAPRTVNNEYSDCQDGSNYIGLHSIGSIENKRFDGYGSYSRPPVFAEHITHSKRKGRILKNVSMDAFQQNFS